MNTNKKTLLLVFTFLSALLIAIYSCSKEDEEERIIITTSNVTKITHTNAYSGGEITSNGGADIISRGICWSTTENPSINDTVIECGNGIGKFICMMIFLEPNTKYFLRAYATNSFETAYGQQEVFTTLGPIYGNGATDIDGNDYGTVHIGDQEWFSTNLKTTTYNDGSAMTNVTESNEWFNLSTGAYCWYENNENFNDTYGALYNWYSVETKKLCPKGWHVPTDTEWSILIEYLTATNNFISHSKLLRVTEGWPGNDNGIDAYGFSALPAGVIDLNSGFNGMSDYSSWWSSTEFNPSNAWFRFIVYNASDVGRYNEEKKVGFSVRCLKDK